MHAVLAHGPETVPQIPASAREGILTGILPFSGAAPHRENGAGPPCVRDVHQTSSRRAGRANPGIST